jgi:hypothetical protein
MHLARTCLTLALALIAAPGIASPGRVAQDVVVVDDGTRWRGTITELVENDHVSVRTSSGEVARIRWDAVSRIERNGKRIALAGPTVHVVLLTEVHSRVLRAGTEEIMCFAPCERDLPTGITYVVRGPKDGTSAPFVLEGPPGSRVSLDVAGGSEGTTGIVLTSIGGGLIAVGLGVAVFQALVAKAGGEEPSVALPAIIVGVGALALVPGLVQLGGGSKPHVLVDVRAPSPPERPAPPPPEPPRPIPELNPTSARVFTLPLFATTF